MNDDPSLRRPTRNSGGRSRSASPRSEASPWPSPLVADLADQRIARGESRAPTVEAGDAPNAVTVLVVSVPGSVDQAWLRQFVETGLITSILQLNGDKAGADASPTVVPPDAAGHLAAGPLRMDLDELRVTLDGLPIALTHQEFLLLKAFMQSPRRVLSREQLLRQAWDYEQWRSGRTVDVHVRRVRAKLGPRAPQIVTVHGFGYRFEPRDAGAVSAGERPAPTAATSQARTATVA